MTTRTAEAEVEFGDDQSDRADQHDDIARCARARERGRVRAILSSDAGKSNPGRAFGIATGTTVSRNQAVEILAGIGVMEAALLPARPAARVLPFAIRTKSGWPS